MYKRQSIVGIERAKLIQKQIDCPWFGVIYAACDAAAQGADISHSIKTYAEQYPENIGDRKLDAIEKTSQRFELVDGMLMRRVYDPWDREVQLRLVAPEGSTQQFELLGQGPQPLEIRAQILLEYHNGPLGGHLGADKTARRIMKDLSLIHI